MLGGLRDRFGRGKAQPVGRPRARSGYLRDNSSQMLSAWQPSLRSASDDVRAAWHQVSAKTRDGLQNNGWLAGIVDSQIGQMIGTGLRLNAAPDFEALGWTAGEGDEWARRVEKRFKVWANTPAECDIRGRQTLGHKAASAIRSFMGFGEIVATLPYRKLDWTLTGTKVELVSPHRLEMRDEGNRLKQGVRMDRYGLPISYSFRLKDELGYERRREIPARDADGRPMVLHIFDGEPEQMRGISPFAPALKVVRQYDQLADGTLTTTLLQTIWAATLKSKSPRSEDAIAGIQSETEQSEIVQFLEDRQEYYEGAKIDLGTFGRVATLFPDDELEFHGAEHPSDRYDSFAKGLLREIARCAGVTYEDGTGDYSGANYAALNMGTTLRWAVVLYRRQNIAAPFYQACYEAWLEEQVGEGLVPFPGGLDGFLANRAAASRASWLGPAKPQGDDLKSAKAYETLKKNGLATDEEIFAERGQDWEDAYEQLARERRRRGVLGLPEPASETDPVADRLVTEPEDA